MTICGSRAATSLACNLPESASLLWLRYSRAIYKPIHPPPMAASPVSPASRISLLRPSASSICSNRAALRRLSSSTTSLVSEFQGDRSSRVHSRRPAAHRHVCLAIDIPGCALRNSRLRSAANPDAGSANFCRTRRRSPTDLTFIKTVNTEEINHDPAVTMAQTGFRLGGRPSMGAWVSYGLGCETRRPARFLSL